MNDKPAALPRVVVEPSFEDYDDVSPAARRACIRYPVLLDPRIASLLHREINVGEFERTHHQEPLVPFVLIALRFLLDRFPSMTKFRFTAGSGGEGSPKIPVIATVQANDQLGCFVALTLDPYILSSDP